MYVSFILYYTFSSLPAPLRSRSSHAVDFYFNLKELVLKAIKTENFRDSLYKNEKNEVWFQSLTYQVHVCIILSVLSVNSCCCAECHRV